MGVFITLFHKLYLGFRNKPNYVRGRLNGTEYLGEAIKDHPFLRAVRFCDYSFHDTVNISVSLPWVRCSAQNELNTSLQSYGLPGANPE